MANAPALSTNLPSLEVSTILSASSGAMRSGLFVCCPWSHFCSSAATACSVPPPCAHAALANKTKTSEHHIKRLFISMSPCWLKFSGAIGCPKGGDVKRSIGSARSKNFPLGGFECNRLVTTTCTLEVQYAEHGEPYPSCQTRLVLC